ncbi:hypothetical protein KY342_05605 [Candidatus Woesearchaeota archaeon]|nr:hypothetical protein [Candidatus Woesearchaeota archaeon]
MGERNRSIFVVMLVIMLVLFLSLISIIFDLTGAFFVFEFLLLLLFLLFGVVFTIGTYISKGSWLWSGLLVFFGANLINLSGLYLGNISFSKILFSLTVGVLGFLIAMIKKRSVEEDDLETEDYSNVETKPEEKIEEKKEVKEDIKTNFIPGKYIASETGKKYHIPKCDWAKKISKKNIVWLNDKQEARKKGYKACKCVK